MGERPLLLSSARSGVLVSGRSHNAGEWFVTPQGEYAWTRITALAAGFLVIAVGAFDIGARVMPLSLSGDVGTLAFAPAIVALEPAVLSSLAPVPAASPATTTPFIPVRLTIPALGVDARVERVGVKPDGSMQNPSNFLRTGWYRFGSRPGEEGNTVIAGHVNNGIGLPGVFARLGTLAIGERVVLRGESGQTLSYTIVEKTQYTTDNAPLEELFRTAGPSQLVLITCEGDWDPETRSYDKRLVVVARPSL